ncbi:malto-oligosyltrehalose synthase [Salegentibacter sp. F188]|uniref:Malto-oligosyltrehalose synthase n=1 Tax=Autumnicola patrickiae TaxID=3075591 RepID=A0ABU3E5Y7_9FLAO|nr:malto-oligosyltrehalose synthase [Salegentibacter sp. F188]MDT0690627.1 malto-oligosyltrehalose synthase [Salegentibacter sp. F188]
MGVPSTTYRLQMSPDFTFVDLERITDYLEKLGVSTVYSAPFFKARTGSTHGYDVTDPFTLNPAIGNLKQFKKLSEDLKQRKMDWLQDIVPNHMAYDSSNQWLRDIVEIGPESRYYNFFDIDWNYKGWGKVMTPFLGYSFEEVIKNGELKLKYDETGFSVNYYEHSYPASVRSYKYILAEINSEKADRLKNFSGNAEEWADVKISFFREVQEDAVLEKNIAEAVENINNSEEKMHQVMELQYFKPVHWKTTESEINYRRFFTINDLICLSMEDDEVFNTYHHFIKELCDNGMITGLRIDHIDGLFDPEGYTEKLRKLVGKDFYIVVEKILEAHEELPAHWPVQGTSGYEFLAQINHLFTNSESKTVFTEKYKELVPDLPEYEEMVYQKKLFILQERMGGELHNLLEYLRTKNLLPEGKQQDDNWQKSLCALLAAFPVYRIYPEGFPLKNSEVETINTAYKWALEHAKEAKNELDYLKSLFLGEIEEKKEESFYFLQRCQQFSGPLAAKGVEDTSFYIYNRLILHNEVGDSPENFGISIKDFHNKMLQKQKTFPHTLNATATHDTKRGEDARMRLSVLSEFPEEWFQKVEEWRRINGNIRKSDKAPDKNEEYFIYQALIGSLPFDDFDKEEFLQRTEDYLQKVMREAKVNSNWSQPDEEHENAVFEFIEAIFNNKEFRKSFDPFWEKIAQLGAVKSYSQVLIKNTVPGIPDTYQGTELWDLSYVDPDNRRPVDYNLRKEILSEFTSLKEENRNDFLKSLKDDFSSGKLKFYCLHKVLSARKEYREVFEKGEYQPLEISGPLENKIIAFARNFEDTTIITIAPVQVKNLLKEELMDFDETALRDSFLKLPKNENWKNLFSEKVMENQEKIELKELFQDLPVALLINKK